MPDARILGRAEFARQTSAGGSGDPRVAVTSDVDPRVAMVLEVLSGREAESVAAEWDIEAQVVHRWVRDFLVAGTAAVTNRPDPDEARQRDRFLATFAHELRTPVTVAKGWAMELAEEGLPPEDAARAIDVLTDSLDRLSTSIYDVELAACVSLGRVRVNREHVAVGALARDLPGSPAVRTGASLLAYADPALLSRILRDLWLTAHRDPAPSSVAVDVIETSAWTEVRVVREGTPISPAVLKALFDPFGANDDTTGVTMGLYIARALTVAHGGLLGAEGDDDTTVLYTRIPRPSTDQEES
ncbi:sensor histidine kinase [Marmoricola sp. RAF53]|uniref:sensor histidine kinase n=1 Tax=Marmoricola sp. RAF53 TaxID=3233059 RepID=UPI003F977344